MSSRSATVLVIFIVAVLAFCLASVFASMTGPISILPNENESGGVLDNLSALTDDIDDSGSSYGYQDYSDDYSSDDSSSDDSSYVETTKDTSSKDTSSYSKDTSSDSSSDSSSYDSDASKSSSSSSVETTVDDSSSSEPVVETTIE